MRDGITNLVSSRSARRSDFERAEPRVSVCIANYNGESLLADCIDSVLSQTAGVGVEIIVHDDASTDRSRAVLDQYPQVRVILSEENVGFCMANNRMVEQARGHYVLLLNNDAALRGDALEVLLQEAELLGPKKILGLPQYDWDSGDLVDMGVRLDPLHVPLPSFSYGSNGVAYVIGACLWISREDWRILGGFPVWMESIAEDLFLCAKARTLGFLVSVPAKSGYKHRQGASFGGNRVDAKGLSTNYRRRYLSERNRAAVLLTCTPGPLAWLWLFVHILALVAEAGALCLAKRDLGPWRNIYGAALVWLWRHRVLLLSARREIQKDRKIGFFKYLEGAYSFRIRKLEMLRKHGLPRLV